MYKSIKKIILFFLFISYLNPFICQGSELDYKIVSSDKIYVKSENIFLLKKGIFVLLEDQIFPVNQINWDSEGVYIGETGYFVSYCGDCGRPFVTGSSCNNPDCPTNNPDNSSDY